MADFKVLASQVENTRKLHAAEAERARQIQEKRAKEIDDKFAEQDVKFDVLMKSLKDELEEIWVMRKDDEAKAALIEDIRAQLKATQAELTLQGVSVKAIELKADKADVVALKERVDALQKAMDAQGADLKKSATEHQTTLERLSAQTSSAAQVADLAKMRGELAAAQARLAEQDTKLQSVTEALKTVLEGHAADLANSLEQVKVQVETAAAAPAAAAAAKKSDDMPKITAESVLKAFNSPFEQTTDAMQEAVRARIAEKMKRFKSTA
jgi:hypothetical protein